MAIRAGRSRTHHLMSEDGEQLIDFLNRAIGDGWPIELGSVIVNDGKRLMLMSQEQANQENLTGQTVKDALHVKVDSDKISDLKSLIRAAYDTFKGNPVKHERMEVASYDKAVRDKPEHDLQIKSELDKRDSVVEKDELKSRERARRFDKRPDRDNTTRDEKPRFTGNRGFKPKEEDSQENDNTKITKERENKDELQDEKVRR